MLHEKFQGIRRIDETEYSPTVYDRKEKLEHVEKLRSEGCSEITALKVVKLSRAVYYRLKKRYAEEGLGGLEPESKRPRRVREKKWNRIIEQRIYHLRCKFPLWGKSKITVRYNQEHTERLSESTVGRIIHKLRLQGRIQSAHFHLYGKNKGKARVFNGWAKRLRYGMKATQQGELVQIDHASIVVPGVGEIKHFSAVCPFTKYAVHHAYRQATSNNAADFLERVRKELPFPLLSIQVDGGSEFMGEFEKASEELSIPLWVLPPRSPKLNGVVERGNGTVKYEFYAQYNKHPSWHHLRKNLQKFVHFYNFTRPHQGIGLLTPWQFFESLRVGPKVSYVMN